MIELTADILRDWAEKHKGELTPEQYTTLIHGAMDITTMSQKEAQYSEALKRLYREQMVKVLDVLTGFKPQDSAGEG
jgi:hypothetical protein